MQILARASMHATRSLLPLFGVPLLASSWFLACWGVETFMALLAIGSVSVSDCITCTTIGVSHRIFSWGVETLWYSKLKRIKQTACEVRLVWGHARGGDSRVPPPPPPPPLSVTMANALSNDALFTGIEERGTVRPAGSLRPRAVWPPAQSVPGEETRPAISVQVRLHLLIWTWP